MLLLNLITDSALDRSNTNLIFCNVRWKKDPRFEGDDILRGWYLQQIRNQDMYESLLIQSVVHGR
jgi:hypothetical protein